MPPWKKVKLGDVAEVQNGYAFKTEDMKEFGIPIIKIKNIQPPNISLPDSDFYPYDIKKNLEQYILKRKDILISMTGSHISQIASAVGKVGRYNSDKLALMNQRVGKLYSIDKSKLNNDFLYYYISRPEIQIELATNAGGSANQANISPQQIKGLEIDLPDIETQSRIASILSAFDDKIELNRQMNNTLEQMAKALYKKYFVTGIDPDNLPEGWRWGKLINEFEIIMGQSPPGSSYNEEKIGIPFFQGRTDFEFRFPSIRIYTTDPKRLAKKFDTLLSVRAPVGDINVANENCCIGRGLAALRNQNGLQSYCFYKLGSLSETLNMYNGEGTVFGSINKDALGSLATIIPKNETVEQFEKLVQPLDEHIYTLSNEISTLVSIRNSLLPKLMNSEIPVDSVSLKESAETIVV